MYGFRKVAEGVYSYKGLQLLDTGGHIIVFDTGYADEAYKLLEAIKDIGKDIRYIVITHGHWDHWANISILLKSRKKPLIIGHRNNPLNLIDVRFDEKYSIVSEGYVIELYHMPGHSQYGDDIVACTVIKEQKICFVGDLVQPIGTSYHECKDPLLIPLFYYPIEYILSLAKLLELRPNILQNGHGITWYGRDAVSAILVTLHTVLALIDFMKKNIKYDKETAIMNTYLDVARQRNAYEIASKRINQNAYDLLKESLVYQPDKISYFVNKTVFDIFDRPSLEAVYELVKSMYESAQ